MALTVFKASAGSGKTFTLAAEYIKYLIVNPDEYKSILAVTFTNKATAEMKERIIYYLNDIAQGSPYEADFFEKIKDYKEVRELHLSDISIRHKAEEALTKILHDYSRFRIETIDSFFQSVVRELAHELDLTANLRVDLNDNEVLADAVNSIIEDVEHDKTLFGIIDQFIEEKTEDSKNWHINNELETFGKNIFNEKYLQLGQQAREEIGNSRFLTEYKKKLIDIRQEALDEVTGTGKQFLEICKNHGYSADNFKNKGKGIYSFFVKAEKGNLDVNATAQKCADNVKEWTGKDEQDSVLLGLVRDTFHKMLVNLVEKKDELALRINTPTILLKHINHLMLLNVINAKVRNLNLDANRFLLADTAHFLNELIDGSDVPFIYEKMGTRFNHIMIDEFQDTSSLQWKNFTPLISNCLSNNDSCLIVGDVKQSIYRWRNSDWQILNNIENGEFRGYVSPENLDTNYRSVENIIKFNNSVNICNTCRIFFIKISKYMRPVIRCFSQCICTDCRICTVCFGFQFPLKLNIYVCRFRYRSCISVLRCPCFGNPVVDFRYRIDVRHLPWYCYICIVCFSVKHYSSSITCSRILLYNEITGILWKILYGYYIICFKLNSTVRSQSLYRALASASCNGVLYITINSVMLRSEISRIIVFILYRCYKSRLFSVRQC